MTVVDSARELARRGVTSEAFRLLSEAEADGQAEAALELAHWRMSGDLIRRDLEQAKQLFGRAWQLGAADAEAPYVAMLASGPGRIERNWSAALDHLRKRANENEAAREQLALIEAMQVNEFGDTAGSFAYELKQRSPKVQVFRNLLSESECRYLINFAAPILHPSVIIDPRSGVLVRDPVRTSEVAVFPFIAETPAIHAINRRIATVSATTYEQGEPLQILSYHPGQEYKRHSDALPNEQNQRKYTLLIYLNDAYSGGETVFPNINWSFRGEPGDGLLFSNVNEDGSPAVKAVHASIPVKAGRKFLASKWIRQEPLDLSGPTGKPF